MKKATLSFEENFKNQLTKNEKRTILGGLDPTKQGVNGQPISTQSQSNGEGGGSGDNEMDIPNSQS